MTVVSVDGSLYCFQNPSTVVSLLYGAKVVEPIEGKRSYRSSKKPQFCKICNIVEPSAE
jgi:hypothetical protein